ncbi:MAG: NAD(P)-dependent oxidoreductase, partial [Lachnospiraceae bacterium]|nr:NAD(P)-dependent oxidoreductase [Candidatus Equihabitans merdae]
GIRTIRDLAQLLAGLSPHDVKATFGQPDANYKENANRHASIRSTAKLESLGWKAQVTPEEGFARTMKALL